MVSLFFTPEFNIRHCSPPPFSIFLPPLFNSIHFPDASLVLFPIHSLCSGFHFTSPKYKIFKFLSSPHTHSSLHTHPFPFHNVRHTSSAYLSPSILPIFYCLLEKFYGFLGDFWEGERFYNTVLFSQQPYILFLFPFSSF
uniref:Uncharacterized protein n=1 Tax=Cacopsylla melanoneura TaxID=428564 RepID=A0A8D8RLF3_9HEMI